MTPPQTSGASKGFPWALLRQQWPTCLPSPKVRTFTGSFIVVPPVRVFLIDLANAFIIPFFLDKFRRRNLWAEAGYILRILFG